MGHLCIILYFNTRSNYNVHYCIKVCKVQTPISCYNKASCKILYNIMISENISAKIVKRMPKCNYVDYHMFKYLCVCYHIIGEIMFHVLRFIS